MNHLEYIFTPGQLTKLSELPADLLRDWRRRGLLDGYGQIQSNGRWRYNLKEVLSLAIARLVLLNVPSVPHALYVADRALISVLCKIHGSEEYKGHSHNFLLIWNAGGIDTPDLQVVGAEDPSELPVSKAPFASYVDAKALASSLNGTLQNVICFGIARPGVDGIHVPSGTN